VRVARARPARAIATSRARIRVTRVDRAYAGRAKAMNARSARSMGFVNGVRITRSTDRRDRRSPRARMLFRHGLHAFTIHHPRLVDHAKVLEMGFTRLQYVTHAHARITRASRVVRTPRHRLHLARRSSSIVARVTSWRAHA